MAMGKRKSQQAPIWIPTTDLPVSPGHPFYVRLNAILDEAGFDRFAEEQCQAFYAPVMGRPGLPPGRYFRLLLLGYFEGLDSERGIAWRAADSLAVRRFVGLGVDAAAPDHSTISRTRRLIDVETHRAVFTWVQERLVTAGLLQGRTVAIDATTLEANAAARCVRPSFIFVILASGSEGFSQSWFDVRFFRRRSRRARASRVGVLMPDAAASRVRKSW